MSASHQSPLPRARFAIAGATGRVGATLANLLAADGVDVVALTRRPDEIRASAGVAVASVDFDRKETLQDALRGVDRFFLSHGTSPRQVENEIALIDAAVAAGVRHIVKLSALGPASRLNPFAWHMQIEAHLARQPVASTAFGHRPTRTFSSLRARRSRLAPGRAPRGEGG
jgi:NAD(P)H dehydrogenase (quinone)